MNKKAALGGDPTAPSSSASAAHRMTATESLFPEIINDFCNKISRMRANVLGHAYPARGPARAESARIPLGPHPWLHQLRSGSLRFVRRLPSYYGGVRLLVPVHHRLRLLTFPMRAGNGNRRAGQTRDLPASDAILLHVMWPWTPAGRQ